MEDEKRLQKPHPFMTDAGVDEVNALLDKADEVDRLNGVSRDTNE